MSSTAAKALIALFVLGLFIAKVYVVVHFIVKYW